MARALLIQTLALALPTMAAACATCLTSAYGDRTYNWAFLGLLLMPFLVGTVIGGVFLYRYGSLQGLFRSLRLLRHPGRSPRASSRVEETT